jgi:hypothetical protein
VKQFFLPASAAEANVDTIENFSFDLPADMPSLG